MDAFALQMPSRTVTFGVYDLGELQSICEVYSILKDRHNVECRNWSMG